jgi:hypothetical protein
MHTHFRFRLAAVWLLAAALLLSGCATALNRHQRQLLRRGLHAVTLQGTRAPAPDSLVVQYLGCGGLLLRRGTGPALLLDPYFSNARPFIGMVGKKIKPDTVSIRRAMQQVDVSNVAALLITHAHYDHLADVPYLYRRYLSAQSPRVYGSQTTRNTLHYFKDIFTDTAKLVNVEPHAAYLDRAGTWYYGAGGSFRFMPLVSEHAAHVKRFKTLRVRLYDGRYANVPTTLRKVGDWREGQTLAYLVDFLNADSSIAYRVHLMTSAAGYGLGKIPEAVLQQKPVDVQALCMASHNVVYDYPTLHIAQAKPQYILAVHWEDFFRPYFARKPKVVRGSSLQLFQQKLQQAGYAPAQWVLPAPLTRVVFRRR